MIKLKQKYLTPWKWNVSTLQNKTTVTTTSFPILHKITFCYRLLCTFFFPIIFTLGENVHIHLSKVPEWFWDILQLSPWLSNCSWDYVKKKWTIILWLICPVRGLVVGEPSPASSFYCTARTMLCPMTFPEQSYSDVHVMKSVQISGYCRMEEARWLCLLLSWIMPRPP